MAQIFTPKDSWASRLYQKHNLSNPATLEELEPLATRLLSNANSALEGAELVLARRIDSKEWNIARIMYANVPASEKFRLLSIQKVIEQEE